MVITEGDSDTETGVVYPVLVSVDELNHTNFAASSIETRTSHKVWDHL